MRYARGNNGFYAYKRGGRVTMSQTKPARGRAPYRVSKKAPRKKKNMVRLIKKVVEGTAEKKIQTYTINTVAPLVLRNGSASAAANFFSMTPGTGYWTISQGTGQADRIGNQVRTHKAILKFEITPSAYNATTNPVPTPCFVRIWFVKYKGLPTNVVPSSAVFNGGSTTFLNVGNTDTGLTGTFQDLQLHVNTDTFTLYGYRTYKIGPSVYEGTGATPTSGNFANNDFKLCVLKTVDITKFMPAKIRWDDTTNDPLTYALTMIVQPIFSTGIAPGALVAPIQFKFSLTYTYTDD